MTDYLFSATHDDGSANLSVSGDLTWPELTDTFIKFLRASGFYFSHLDLEDYLVHRLIEAIEADDQRETDE